MHLGSPLLALLLLACGETRGEADAGSDAFGHLVVDGEAPLADAAPRLTPHDGVTLPAMKLGVVYIGELDAGGPPSNDAAIGWLLGSSYWLLLGEYGLGSGAIVGSVRVPASAFFETGDVADGLVDFLVLHARIARSIHGEPDGGASIVTIAEAEAYAFYLPDGVNVAVGHSGSYTYRTCVDANGYHAFDGLEPYAVLPPCSMGRSLYAAAHELAEMASDPQPYHGWVSDGDIPGNGGEVADVCTEPAVEENFTVTQLWSNEAGVCVP